MHRFIWQLYSLIIRFFINYYKYLFNIQTIQLPQPTKITDIDLYIKQNTDRFLISFTKTTNILNSNIDPLFYVKTAFLDTIKNEENSIEPEWKRRILFETTPRGNIIMYYDAYKQGFTYFSDTNCIPYIVLNAVAMKYVLTFFCRDFFVDDQVTPENSPSPLIEIHYAIPKINKPKQDSTSTNTLQSAPFAKFKNYSKSTDNTQINNITKLDNEYNRNKFFSLGKIVNFKMLQPTKKTYMLNGFKSPILDNLSTETALQKQVMNYKDYKNTKQ